MKNSEINIVLYDGVCSLCNKTVQFIISCDSKSKFKFASLQSESGQLLLAQIGSPNDNFDSIIYICDTRFFIKSTAVMRILRELDGGWHLLSFFIIIPRVFRDMVYDIISKWRYKWFGKSDTCMIPMQEYKARFLD